MNKSMWYDFEPSEEDLARLRAALDAHAEEIALTAAGAGDNWLVYGVMERSGSWWGTMTLSRGDDPGAYIAAESLAFAFPARCRTAEDVRQLVREHLGDAGAP